MEGLKVVDKKDEPENKINPEDIPVSITERELKEQLGHMTVQLLASEKTQIHLREIIKGLRTELEKSEKS